LYLCTLKRASTGGASAIGASSIALGLHRPCETINRIFISLFMLMKKKKYEKPSMKVYELNQQPQILVGSFTGSRGTPYGAPEGY